MPIHDWGKVPDGVFHSFHLAWLGRLQDRLNNELLPEPYYALTETVTGEAVPDVLTLQARGEAPGRSLDAKQTSPGTAVFDDSQQSAVAVAPFPVVVQDLGPEPYDRLARRIVIRSEWEGEAVVAVLELVSRSNKTSRAKADQVVEKILALLGKGIHVLLIDLQPATQTVPGGFHARVCEQYNEGALPLPPDRKLLAVSYQVLETGRIRSHAAPLKVGDHLPDMPIFLLPHKFVRVPLEKTYIESFHSLPRKFRDALLA